LSRTSFSPEVVLWLVAVLGVWALVAALIAFLLYRLAKTAIHKTDARDVPKVLSAFTELVKCFRRSALTPPQLPFSFPAPAADSTVGEQTGQQSISGTEAAQ
jgi:hypothetical protein